MMFEDIFIAIYTNQCKSYCDEAFFDNLFNTDTGNTKIMVVDNTRASQYHTDLRRRYGDECRIEHLVTSEDISTQFQRNVAESLLFLREEFLKGTWQYFVILESDVLPENKNWLNFFMEVIEQADIIGGLYYRGFHGEELWTGGDRIVLTYHVLSGCALYKRFIIEEIPFRWSYENTGAFPDAWLCYDSSKCSRPVRIANYTKIKCRHLEKSPGNRGQSEII